MMPTRRHSRWIGNTVIATAVLLYIVVMVLDPPRPRADVWAIWTVYLLYALVGGLVLRHSARNPMGTFVAVMGAIPLLGNLAEVVIANGEAPQGLLGDLVAWIYIWYFPVFLGAFVALFHVFPTGRAMSGVWRWWYRIALIGSASLVLTSMFGPADEGSINPFEIPFEVPGLAFVVGPALIVGLVTGVVSLGVRYRQSRRRERDQLKWFLFSVVVAVVVFVGSAFLSEELGWIPVALGETMAVAAFSLPALGIFFAVARHGLFDIDRIVSRTVLYAMVGLAVAAVYVVPVVVLPEVLGLSGELAVAAATLAAAAVFNPLRHRLQSKVDRRFDRQRYDAERVLSAFSGRLQSAVDLGRVTEELGQAVGEALRPNALTLWVAEPSGKQAAR